MMIITVTLNPAIDRTFFIEDFIWNKTIRASLSVVGMGGKGTDASWILGELGYENTALGFAAGNVGREIDQMLRERGSKTDFIWVDGETRTNVVIVSNKRLGQSTLSSNNLEISSRDIETFKDKFQRRIKQASCVVIGGSLPPGVQVSIYTDLVKTAKAANIPVIFDASGPGLQAGLAGRPCFIKPNIDEIADLTGEKIADLESAYLQAKRLQEKYETSIIITLGELGALAVLTDRTYRIPPINIKVVSAAGAGDGVLAGLAAALSRGRSIEEGLQLGFAAAAAVCLTPATADCRREDVEALISKVQLIPYP